MAARVEKGNLGDFCDGRIASCRSSEASSEASFGEDKQAGDDARTMSMRYLAIGERGRNFRDSIKEFVQVEFDDWPLQPRTCQDYLSAISEVGESCYMQHLAWVQQAKIPEGDRAITQP